MHFSVLIELHTQSLPATNSFDIDNLHILINRCDRYLRLSSSKTYKTKSSGAGKFWAAFFHTHSLSFFGNRSTERASGPTCRLSICFKIAGSQIVNEIHFIGPCSHREKDYCIPSNFWKFYLIRTSFTFGEPVSLMKLLYCLNWNRCLFWCSECGHGRLMYNILFIGRASVFVTPC